MSLRQTLYTQATSQINGIDEGWYYFVLDHIPAIRANGRILKVSPDMMAICAYDLPRFLLSQSISTDLEWIIYLLNPFSSELGFYAPPGQSFQFTVPTYEYIQELYEDYQTSNQTTTTLI